MMTLNPELIERLKLLESVLKTYSKEEIHELMSQTAVVDKIKGSDSAIDGVSEFLRNYNDMCNRVYMLEAQVTTQSTEMTQLIRALNETLFKPIPVIAPHSQEFTSLKSKHGIY